MRIVFIGTVLFSKDTLEKLIDLGADIVGVCTKERSPFNSDFTDLTLLCTKHNIPYRFTENINASDSVEWIKQLAPDIIFCFGWSSLIKSEVLNLPPMGVLGFHPAQLPLNRGRHPLIWALFLGLEKTASTFFFMKEGADDGDILSQKEINIVYEDDAASLYRKVTNTALLQIESFLPQLQNKEYNLIKQDHKRANTWRKRSVKDGEIDFRMGSYAIYNLVRALTAPYIGAHVNYNGKKIKVWKVKEKPCHLPNIEPGKILEVKDNNILVKCYDNTISLIKHDFDQMPVEGEYL